MDIDIAVASDRNMEVGLHVTLYTTLKFLNSDCFARLHVFAKDLGAKSIQRLYDTLSPYRGRYSLKVYDATKLELGNGKSLHTSKMPYVILIAPDLIQSDRLLFLDADLLVLTDLAQVFTQTLQGKTAGAIFQCRLAEAWSKEYDVLSRSGLGADTPYFSTGVMLFNQRQWREKRMTDRCFEFIEQHAAELHNTDQTVLNAVLFNDVTLLPEKYNKPFYPSGWEIEVNTLDYVVHFGGSPKPWDFLGEVLNVNYPIFKKYLVETAFANYKSYLDFTPSKVKRTLHLSRSYSQAVQKLAQKRIRAWSLSDRVKQPL